MTPDRCCLNKKWVFKINRNGIFRARLVACGYSQISGVDYTADYAPVINDITWRLILIVILLNNYDGKILDTEIAFLYVKQVKVLTTYKMPGTPSVGIVRPTDKKKVVSKEYHEQYRTGAGMLL